MCTDAAYLASFKVDEQDHRLYRRDDGGLYRRNRLYQQRIEGRSGQRLELRLITEYDAQVM